MTIEARIAAKFANVMRGPGDMHAYQAEEAVPFMLANPFSGLFVDMGLGKTVSALTVIADVVSEMNGGGILVIAPRRVACETWPTEIGLWQHTAWMSHSLIHAIDDDPRLKAAAAVARAKARAEGASPGDVTKAGQKAMTLEKEKIRIEAARKPSRIHIVSRDWVEWLVEYWGKNWPYRTVFIDESSSFKDHNSSRFKALARIRNHPGLITRLHILTATPAAETYEHLFPQIFLLDRGERFGKHITHFRREYFTENRWTHKWELRPGAEEEILAKIADICLVMKAKDYLKMDDPLIVQRPVVLDEHAMALYQQMEKDFIVTLPEGVEVEAETAAALSQKLLQMASGVLYETYFDKDVATDDMVKVKRVHKIHDHKIEALKEIVEALQGQPILVAYHHRASLDRLKKAFPRATVMDRDGKCVKSWNKGKIPMLLIHPQSGGHGLNMQHGGHNIVFFDLPWSLELYIQLIGRLARQGQQKAVVVQLLIAAGTLDEAVYRALMNKEDGQSKLFGILKRLIRQYKMRRAGA